MGEQESEAVFSINLKLNLNAFSIPLDVFYFVLVELHMPL